MTGYVQADSNGAIALLLVGICTGGLLALAAGMLRAPRPAARWTGFAFFVTSACFAIKLWCDETQALPYELYVLINLAAWTSCGWFWLMAMALFEDRDRFEPWMYAAPAAQFVLGIGHRLPWEAAHPYFWAASTILQSTLAILAFLIVVRSWKGDLVEQRRRVRGPFMAVVALYILSLNVFDIWEMLGSAPAWYPMFNSLLFAVVVMSGAFAFLQARSVLVGEKGEPIAPGVPAAEPVVVAAETKENGHTPGHPAMAALPFVAPGETAPLDRATKADLDRLECLMTKDQVWLEEGLTIASLAVRVNMPEAQLRRLINDRLGYRNFPSFVNAHRIRAAKARLADPNEARTSVSAIAFDIGFASLGPFNRAFREETGQSPTEWRRQALGLTVETANQAAE